MLALLMRRSPEVVSRAELENHVWPHEDVGTGNFNVHLHQLRKVVDYPFPSPLIHTVVGVGLCVRDKQELREETP